MYYYHSNQVVAILLAAILLEEFSSKSGQLCALPALHVIYKNENRCDMIHSPGIEKYKFEV